MAEDCWLKARLYLGLEHSPEQQDNEPLCFSILVGHGQSHTFRVELASDLAIWEKSFQRAVFFEVQRIQVSYSAVHALLGINWQDSRGEARGGGGARGTTKCFDPPIAPEFFSQYSQSFHLDVLLLYDLIILKHKQLC